MAEKRGIVLRVRRYFFAVLFAVYAAAALSGIVFAEGEPAPVNEPPNRLSSVEGEILEVNALKDPPGSAIYKVKVFDSGETLDLFADRDRTLIVAGEEIKEPPDVLGGTKATIIYGEVKKQDLPVIVFARIASTIST